MSKKLAGIESILRRFSEHLLNKGLRNTHQRQQIIRTFLNTTGHLTTEEIYHITKKEDPSLGQATVYRTMKLLCEAKLAREVRFSDGIARYEHFNEHHDHLICDTCGINFEFIDPTIEKLQQKYAKQYGFILKSHRLYLYGICPTCQNVSL